MNANNDIDEEIVYIYLMKYCEIIHYMKKTYSDDTKYITGMHGSHLKKAINMLIHIKESLEDR